MTPTHVLDTCAFLDLVTSRWTERVAMQAFTNSAHPVLLSVSVWKISRKVLLGKLKLPCDQEGILPFVREVCSHYALHLEPVEAATCHRAECLPLLHRDPFDRMILARAVQAGCPVITSDRRFVDYDVEVLWHRG